MVREPVLQFFAPRRPQRLYPVSALPGPFHIRSHLLRIQDEHPFRLLHRLRSVPFFHSNNILTRGGTYLQTLRRFAPRPSHGLRPRAPPSNTAEGGHGFGGMCLLSSLFLAVFEDEIQFCGESLHIPVQGLDERGVDGGKDGKDQVADFVPFVPVQGIGAVLAPGQALLAGKGFNLFPGHGEERPSEGNVPKVRIREKAFRLHARDAAQPGSA